MRIAVCLTLVPDPDTIEVDPLTGEIDSDRASQITERMLDAVASKRARHAILDLTGVETVSAQTAAYLISLVRAIRLLGAEAIITGIRPSVAQLFVSLGTDLSSIPTRANLRSGLEYCMSHSDVAAKR
ncbi:MAG: STAS domain-containing protein [Rhodospirillales bacterium]|nr:STAS domain-containing protein [Rhodospirillales bacterium]